MKIKENGGLFVGIQGRLDVAVNGIPQSTNIQTQSNNIVQNVEQQTLQTLHDIRIVLDSIQVPQRAIASVDSLI